MPIVSNTNSDIREVLKSITELASSMKEQGTIFERMVKVWLLSDPEWQQRFSNVWLWEEWKHRTGSDVGIDLVAEEVLGGYCAIQCKFVAESSSLDAADIATFLSFSQTTHPVRFTSRLIAATTDHWTTNAERIIANQEPPVTRVGLASMENSTIDWSYFDLASTNRIQTKKVKELRPHQDEAVTSVIQGFQQHDSGKLIMACGTGKTFTALRLSELIVPSGGSVLFVVPSISLLSQSLQEWTAEAKRPLQCFAVCSDPQATRKKDDEDIRTYDLALPATTRPDVLSGHYAVAQKRSKDHNNPLYVFFCTYQSLERVGEAQKKGLPRFDLVICDEAHRTTGVSDPDNTDSKGFHLIHEPGVIQRKKTLFMTATPRIYTEEARGRAKEKELTVYTMNDEEQFGPEFYHLGFGKAVELDLLSDYRVVILTVDEENTAQVLHSVMSSTDHELELPDATKLFGCWKGLSKIWEDEETSAVMRNLA